ncbi:MAG: hypothetical protein AAGI30_06870 [Planctomycetota bacterium]
MIRAMAWWRQACAITVFMVCGAPAVAQADSVTDDPLAVVTAAPPSATMAAAVRHTDELAASEVTETISEVVASFDLGVWLDPLGATLGEQLGLEASWLEPRTRGGMVGVFSRSDGGVGGFADVTETDALALTAKLRATPRLTRRGFTVLSVAGGRAELTVRPAEDGRRRVLIATPGWVTELVESEQAARGPRERTVAEGFVASLEPRDVAARLQRSGIDLMMTAKIEHRSIHVHAALVEPALHDVAEWDASLVEALAGADAAYAIGEGTSSGFLGVSIRNELGLTRIDADLLGEPVLVGAHAGAPDGDGHPSLVAATRLADVEDALARVDAAMAAWLSPDDRSAADFGGRFPDAVRAVTLGEHTGHGPWPGDTLAWAGVPGEWLVLASTEDRARSALDVLNRADRASRRGSAALGGWRSVGVVRPDALERFTRDAGRPGPWLDFLSDVSVVSWRAKAGPDGATLIEMSAEVAPDVEPAP